MTWQPTPEEVAEEDAFRRLYGEWQALDPAGTAAFMAGYPGEWWVVGGWAIEAFTGVARRHEDIDLVSGRRDLPLLRAHVGDRHHIWSAGGGAIRPVNDDWPEPHAEAGQVWLRDHATAPWFLDCILREDRDGLWVSRRDEAARRAARRRHLGGRRRHPLHAARGRAAPQGAAAPTQGHRRPRGRVAAAGRRRAGLAARRRTTRTRRPPVAVRDVGGVTPAQPRPMAQATAARASPGLSRPTSRRRTASTCAADSGPACPAGRVRRRRHPSGPTGSALPRVAAR